MSYKSIIGSRAEVWHGTAKKTSGGLSKAQLFKNKSGRIVSRKKHFSAKKDNRLVKAGYKTKRGQFGFVKVGSRRHGKGKKGGNPFLRGGKYMAPIMAAPASWDESAPLARVLSGGAMSALSPANVNSTDITGGRGKRRKMRGGTIKYPLNPADVNDPLNRALGA